MGFATIAVKCASLNFHLEISLIFFTKRQVFVLFYVIFFILCNGFDLKVKSTTLDPPPSTLDSRPSTLDPRQRDRLLQWAESVVAPIKSSRSHRSLRCNYFLVIQPFNFSMSSTNLDLAPDEDYHCEGKFY